MDSFVGVQTVLGPAVVSQMLLSSMALVVAIDCERIQSALHLETRFAIIKSQLLLIACGSSIYLVCGSDWSDCLTLSSFKLHSKQSVSVGRKDPEL